MNQKAYFDGCSLTVGAGFAPDQRDAYIYDRLVSTACGFLRHNFAQRGSSNHEIFMRSSRALAQDFDIYFVQWSGLNRMWFYPGPDTKWFSNDGEDTYRYRNIYLDAQSKQQFRAYLWLMNHDYHNIFALIDYCSILCRLAEFHSKTIVYINGLVPWCDDLNHRQEITNLDRCLAPYTKKLLDFNDRDDQEVIEHFERLQSKFAELDTSRWVNLFDSFHTSAIDNGPEGHHPGIKSHAVMADKIIRYLFENRIV